MSNKCLLIITVLIGCTWSIKFGMVIERMSSQCFKENIQKQTRYQVIVKGNSSRFYLHINENQKTLHEDTSSNHNQQFKYFSAFASSNGEVLFCIGNLQHEEKILVIIEFYHGLHLQDSAGEMKDLVDVGSRISQLKDLIKANYEMYGSTLASRKQQGTNLISWIFWTTILIVVCTTISQFYLFRGISKYLRYKKIL